MSATRAPLVEILRTGLEQIHTRWHQRHYVYAVFFFSESIVRMCEYALLRRENASVNRSVPLKTNAVPSQWYSVKGLLK